ncbi:thymidine kinase (plasmid) [Brevibacillus halotolerans]|nr:thymidine kinase [Brevibacillus halotolerans]
MKKGKITVITGPMFSEKSGELIDRILKLERFGGKVIKAYKPTEDDRFADDKIVSRMGYSYLATSIPKKLTDKIIKQILVETKAVDVVAFDESQFFSKQIMGVAEELAFRGKHVICAGLNMDYRGKEFGFMGGLLAIAEEIVTLVSFCAVCKSPEARFTQRLLHGKPVKSGPIVMIEHSDEVYVYEPRCRFCYVPPHKVE